MKKYPDLSVLEIRRSLVSTALLLLALVAVPPQLHAQRRYGLDSAPNVTMRSTQTASIDQVIGLPDGKVLVVGQSKFVNGAQTTQTGIVRLKSSGQLDPAFTGPTGHTVVQAALTPNGGIWALGDFNGTYSDSVVKLTANGTLVPGFSPIAATGGNRLVVLADGGFYLFDSSTGFTNVHRFGPDGQAVPGFTPVVASSPVSFSTASPTGEIALLTYGTGPAGVLVYDGTGAALPNATVGIPADFFETGIALDSQGGMVLSGTSFPAPSPMLIRILPNGLRDSAFDGTTPVAGPFSDGVVALADGNFATYMRSGWGYPAQVLEFSATGTLEKLFPVDYDPAGDSPYIVAVWSFPVGGFAVSGNFDRLAGVTAPSLGRVTSDGVVDAGFKTLFESTAQVTTLAQSAGGVFVGGYFTRVNQRAAGNLAILNGQNTVDTSFPFMRWGTTAIVSITGGGALVMGGFSPLPGTDTFGLAKLESNRAVDTGFLSGVSLSGFSAGLSLPNGSTIIGGSFGGYTGAAASFLIRTTPSGTIDPTFNSNFALSGGWQPSISSVAVHPAGGYLVGGSFTEMQGTSRAALARITVDGMLDPSFVPPVGMSPYLPPKNITVLPDGRFYVLGALTDAVNWWQANLYRFKADGTVDTTFTSPFDLVQAYAVAGDGDVFVAGDKLNAAPNSYANLVRVTTAGTIDPTFAFTLDATPTALLIDGKGRLVLGGSFTMINGQSRESLARLVPLPLSVTIGGSARLSVPLRGTVALSANVASAVGPISYQWYHDCEKIRNATAATLTLTRVQPKDEGRYTVVVSAAGETAESPSVTLIVTPAH